MNKAEEIEQKYKLAFLAVIEAGLKTNEITLTHLAGIMANLLHYVDVAKTEVGLQSIREEGWNQFGNG